jgi:serine/threonine protein kinase/Flp pilus assembly protein TadD
MFGKTILRYRIIDLLGHGGMGRVYKAEDTKLGRPVALKFLAEHLSADPTALERFRREAQAASALNHPNICTIYDIDEFESQPFIAMEFLQGKTLRDRLAEGPMKIETLVALATQLASALGAAHNAGILHRDVKPANIFVTDREQAKILDFGLAKLQADYSDAPTIDDAHLTRTGSAMGTVAYMSPEQARGAELDARSDLFSLGAVLYEMATGRPAFPGDTPAVMFDGILNRTPTPPTQLNPNIPPSLEQIILRLLQKDPKNRYQRAADLEADLHHPAPIQKRNRVRLIVPAAVVAAALMAAVFLLLNRRSEVLTDRDVIVLADFNNETGDPVFDGTLKQALAFQLEQSQRLNILPEDDVRDTLLLMRRSPDEKVTDALAREICEREGLKAVLGGSIVPLGANYVLTLNALNCQTGASLAREQREARSKEQVLEALGEAASNLRIKLGESLPTLEKSDVPFEHKVTTTSLEAFKAYAEAMELDSQGKYSEAIPFLEKAVGLDPNFVAAYSLLRVVNSNRGDADSARYYATKAYELRDKASERERLRLMAAYQTQVLGNLDQALQTYDQFRRMYPKDYIAWNGMAVTHRSLGRFEDSLKEFQHVITMRAKPLNYAQLSQGYLSNGQFAEARDVAVKAVAEKHDFDALHQILYDIAFIEGNQSAMERELDVLKVAPANRPPQGTLIFLGRLSEVRKRNGDVPNLQELLFGYRGQTVADAKEALRKHRNSLDAAVTAAIAGEREALQALEESSKKAPEDTFLNSVDIPTAKAALALHEGKPAEAVDALKPVLRYEPSYRSLMAVYLRGQAHLQRKSGVEAAVEFQKILGHRGVVLRSPLFPLAHLGLARSYTLSGDHAKAREAYDNFFAIWKDADPDIPILVQAKAEYAKLGK